MWRGDSEGGIVEERQVVVHASWLPRTMCRRLAASIFFHGSTLSNEREAHVAKSYCSAPSHSSVKRSSKWMLKIITSSPMVTMMNRAKANQPSTIALVPTPLRTLPFPKSWAICAAATDAVCCHSTDTRTKIEAMKMRARATCETGREGKGLMSMSEPVRASRSSCQPGKVARRRKVTKARMIATML